MNLRFLRCSVVALFMFAAGSVFHAFALPPQSASTASKPVTKKRTASTAKSTSAKSAKKAAPKAAPKTAASANPSSNTAEQRLDALSHRLFDKRTTVAYDDLAEFARAREKSTLGARASLALGYYSYREKRYAEAAPWLEKAAADPLLKDYVLYWSGMNNRATGANEQALAQLQEYRRQYPDGVMSDSAVEELARAALALDRPKDARAALETYGRTASLASLLLLRAQARDVLDAAVDAPPLAAASDYLDIYYRFPLGDEARTAALRIPDLRIRLGEKFPGTPLTLQVARAEALYQAGRWRDAQIAYRELLPQLSGSAHQRADLRIAGASLQLGAGVSALSSLEIADPDLDAERLNLTAQEYRAKNDEARMLETVELAAQKYPQSLSTADALYMAGSYYWNKLDRERGAQFYLRVVAAAPDGPNAPVAQWRVIWAGYMARKDVRQEMETYLRQYPTSAYAVDAIYFLGRANERFGNVPHARSMYLAAAERYPQTYFGGYAAARLHELGSQPVNPADFLALYPLAPPLPAFSKAVPPAAAERWSRAQALRSIAFDQSAELELRSAHELSPAPALLYAISEAAAAAGRYPVSITTARQLLPRVEARQFADVPGEIWRIAYPWPYREEIEREALRNNLEAALVAGLIRQESAFAHDALSSSNAMGLMQVLPSTGSGLAAKLKVSYSRSRLNDPDYNLRLGAYYLANLLKRFGKPELAVAAYNAGETRVSEWMNGQTYDEMPEFVESIPIAQTRDYVQIVLRNSGLYRRIYGPQGAVTASAAPAAATP
jgi:soluble lytic murein transglycosylase